jgi:ech hydrogenase subunit B
MKQLYFGLAYVACAPFLGGLIAGFDRIVTARMQRRVGPPILQPFYDVAKLLGKRTIIVNRLQNPYIFCHLIFMIATGFLFFEGSDILLIFFVLSLSAVFFVLAAYSSNSPYSFIGAERELLLIMTYEPMVLLSLVGIYMVTGTFNFHEIIGSGKNILIYLPGVFAGFVYILTMKLRKSPFDLSYSHHAHQELVKGITSDFSGKTLAMVEVAHWYENIFLLGFIFLFVGFNPWIGAGIIAATYLFEILIDNVFARVKWQFAFKAGWIVAFVLGFSNIVVLYIMREATDVVIR